MGATYLIDDVPLDDPEGRWFLEAATKVPAVANRRVTVMDLPFRDGALSCRQGMGTGSVAISVAIPAAADDQFRFDDRNYTQLVGLLTCARTVTFIPGGNQRKRSTSVVQAEVSEPEMRGTNAVVIQAVLTVQPFWKEVTPSVSTMPIMETKPLKSGPILFEQFSDCTGKLVDATLTLAGPFTSLTLKADDGSSLFIPDREAGQKTSISLNRGLPTGVDYGPAGILALKPDPSIGKGAMRILASGANMTDQSKITIASFRWYL